MTTTLPHLRTLLLCLLFPLSLSAFAQSDDDTDNSGDLPMIPPHRVASAVVSASVLVSSADITVVFAEEEDALTIEVLSEDGATVYAATGTVDPGSVARVDTRRWKKGRYTLRLSAQGKPTRSAILKLE